MSKSRRSAAFASAAGAAAAAGPVGLVTRLAALPRLVRDVLTGRFTGVSRRRLALMGLALLYIVSPIDLLPEAILTLPGLVDDVAVAGWLVAAALGATSAYLTWESAPSGGVSEFGADPRVVPGEVVTH